MILLDQSSTHSMILKFREESLKNGRKIKYSKETTIFKGIRIFDIFDEVDAQLSPKKSFVYSIGKSSTLDLL